MAEPTAEVLGTISQDLKKLLVASFSLDGVKPEDIADDEILIGEGLGLDSFSASPVQIPLVKRIIRSVEMTFARSVAEQALTLKTGKEVEAFLVANLKQVAPDLVGV